MNNKTAEDKPDFEAMALQVVKSWNYHTVDDQDSVKTGMEEIWNTHVTPLKKRIEELEAERDKAINVLGLLTKYWIEPNLDTRNVLLENIKEYLNPSTNGKQD